MCGLFGFVGPHSWRASLILQALSIADEVRGRHSTGIAISTRDPETHRPKGVLVKRALAGAAFVRQGFTRFLFQNRFRMAIGHNRYATAGEVNDRNAHPFTVPTPVGTVYACHNGIVGGQAALAEKFGVQNRPVDSEVLFKAIGSRVGRSEESLLDAIEAVVREIAGRADFACLWLDPARRGVWFWRSHERPLVVVDGRSVGLGRWLASTIEIFSNAWATIRGTLPPLSRLRYFEAKPHTIYRLVDDGNGEVDAVRRMDIPPRAPAVSNVPDPPDDEPDGAEVVDEDPAFEADLWK